jgi:methyl-accepting chemotaxis protein
MNLQTRSLCIIAFILFLALGINTAVLTYLAYDRVRQDVILKATSGGESISREIAKAGSLGISIEGMEGLHDKIKSLTKDKTVTYAMVLDTEGEVLLHSNEEHIGKVFKDAATLKALASKGIVQQRWGTFYDTSVPIVDAKEKKVGIVRVGVSATVLDKELYDLLFWTTTLSFVVFIVFIAVMYYLVSLYITEPIRGIEKIARKMSTGDMTGNIELKGKDEIASLSDAINTMSANLRDMIVKIKDIASTVSETTSSITESPAGILRSIDFQKGALKEHSYLVEEMHTSISSIAKNSESLYKSSEEETNALEEITKSVSQVAESANTFYINALEAAASVEEMMSSIKETARIIEVLSASAEESATALKEVDDTISKIHKSAEESVHLAEKVSLDASEKGLTSLNIATQGIEDIKKSVNAIAVTISRLEKRSEEIGSILHVIDEVAAQTNLLSLNAAILAAQAGEHGKSFIVVADEIKRLAEKTSASTKEIAELITTVQKETQSCVVITSEGIETVERGAGLIKEVDKALYSILESSRAATEMSKFIQKATAEEENAIKLVTGSIKQTTDQIDLIWRATREQSRGSNIIVEASEKIRAGSEQLKSTTERQSKSIKQISYISENVSGQAKQIHVEMAKREVMNKEIVVAIEKIQTTTAALVQSAKEMNSDIESLSTDAKTILTEIKKFTV